MSSHTTTIRVSTDTQKKLEKIKLYIAYKEQDTSISFDRVISDLIKQYEATKEVAA